MKIVSKINECRHYARPCRARTLSRIKRIIIHRIGPDLNGVPVRTAEDVAAFFGANPAWTGGKMAYHYVITADGEVQQAEPDESICMHTKGYNRESIGIAVVGDFRRKTIRPHQYAALVSLVTHLITKHELELKFVKGHTDHRGGSNDPNKICPGKGIDFKALREDVEYEIRT